MTLPAALAAVVDLQHAHRELLRVVDSLKPEDWQRGVPYGEWTVKDLVSHCIGDMSPSGPGLIAAGVLTPQFIAETSETFDVRSRNRDMIEERRHYTPEDLRQLLSRRTTPRSPPRCAWTSRTRRCWSTPCRWVPAMRSRCSTGSGTATTTASTLTTSAARSISIGRRNARPSSRSWKTQSA